MKKLLRKPTIQKLAKKAAPVAGMLLLTAVCALSLSMTAHASGTKAITAKMNNLKSLVGAVISGIGTVVCLWGISELGMAMQANDGMTQSQALKRVGGGLVMILAPQVLTVLTA